MDMWEKSPMTKSMPLKLRNESDWFFGMVSLGKMVYLKGPWMNKILRLDIWMHSYTAWRIEHELILSGSSIQVQ